MSGKTAPRAKAKPQRQREAEGAPETAPTEDRSSTDALKGQLRAVGLRATGPRILVLRTLMASAAPITHAEVCERLGESGLDRATVYRNLLDLTEVGLARRTDLGDHLWRFELAEHRGHTHDDEVHPHFVCTECGAVECLPEGVVTLEAYRGAPRSIKTRTVEIQVRGACNECQVG